MPYFQVTFNTIYTAYRLRKLSFFKKLKMVYYNVYGKIKAYNIRGLLIIFKLIEFYP